MAYLQNYSWNDSRRGFRQGGGLGFLPAAALPLAGATGPLAPLVIAATLLPGVIMAARSMIGKGRKEADIIVPVQNAFGDRLTMINNYIDQVGVDQLQNWITELQDMGAKFVAFTRDAGFKDGRASKQARMTIMPLVDGTDGEGNVIRQDGGTLGTIVRRIYELIGVSGMQAPPTITQGGPPALRLPGNLPILPQSGLLPPNQTPPIWETLTGGAGPPNSGSIEQLTASLGGGFDPTTILLVGAVAYFLLSKRGR